MSGQEAKSITEGQVSWASQAIETILYLLSKHSECVLWERLQGLEATGDMTPLRFVMDRSAAMGRAAVGGHERKRGPFRTQVRPRCEVRSDGALAGL